MSPAVSPPSLIGQAPSFLGLMEHVSQAAPLNRPTLVIGERGTGKELVAARLHYLSPRWDKPFVKLNCAALSDTLLETELFGHEAGSFTGAAKRHVGRFELADGGTLFLDEIATATLRVQEKILRVIEYGEFERVGGNTTIQIDVRVVGATNADLPRLADQGKFRADLLDRLSFDVVTIPPMRARPEDIPILAEHFGVAMARELGRPFFGGFTPDAMQQMLAYDWPGNVRELKNVVERAVYRAGDPESPITDIHFDPFQSPWRPKQMSIYDDAAPAPIVVTMPPAASAPSAPAATAPADSTGPALPDGPCDFLGLVADYEKVLLRNALERNQFHQKRAATDLGLNYHQFRGYLRKYGLLERRHGPREADDGDEGDEG
ncbi:phage shock protein operon transcriptional activator [Niveispirillum cyanobacteriorum]|uniref:Phage shock protein operon transcriptional activator n=1 Tax=Niveispirillum cyanobacteriorum TaxID=1612173 RepID=A0A2K9NFS7_9PROT|nr:phage shock protein operon transcriptional activator [Niveispirillum cyanobacteriorum]AUN31095.1 phage shock protein operon transcriptional activator [Niveispirillum cyanobacteriorum]GGE84515.1 PSP operon transcriptional activator [Niveispirillum cyanobacteriorum]